jgi:hypothetical protein
MKEKRLKNIFRQKRKTAGKRPAVSLGVISALSVLLVALLWSVALAAVLRTLLHSAVLGALGFLLFLLWLFASAIHFRLILLCILIPVTQSYCLQKTFVYAGKAPKI